MKGMQFSKDAESVARRVKEVNAERLEIDKQTGDFQERTLENLRREENRLLELIEPITQINMLKAQQLKIEKDIKETQNVNEDVDVEPFTKDEDAEFFGEDEKKSFDDYSEAMFNKMVVDEQAKQQEEERLRLRKQFIATYPEEAAQLGMLTEEQAKLEKIKEKFSLKAKAVKIRETHYDLQHEILTFGKRMAHDDTIDALAYAVKYAHPPTGAENTSGEWIRRQIDKPKNWVLA